MCTFVSSFTGCVCNYANLFEYFWLCFFSGSLCKVFQKSPLTRLWPLSHMLIYLRSLSMDNTERQEVSQCSNQRVANSNHDSVTFFVEIWSRNQRLFSPFLYFKKAILASSERIGMDWFVRKQGGLNS